MAGTDIVECVQDGQRLFPNLMDIPGKDTLAALILFLEKKAEILLSHIRR
jgi:hypothetical protein